MTCNIHKAACSCSVFQEEIQQQKLKLERVEKERNELRLNTDRLESRVGPAAYGNAFWEDGVGN